MGNLSYTTGGESNLVSFKSAARVPITSLKAHFLPKQDLHGYGKPWVGGSGKNLFNWQDSSIIYNMWPDNVQINVQSNTKSIIMPCQTNTTYTISKNKDSVIFVACWIKEAPTQDVPIYGRIQVNEGPITITTGEDAAFLVCWYYNNVYGNEQYTDEQIAQTIQIEISSTATSYEPYENICPIEGWNSCTMYKTGKNVGHIIGYSAGSLNSPTATRYTIGSYGNSISTKDYQLPDTSVVITQTQWPNTTTKSHYTNGYCCVAFDNLIFGQRYDFSFKITNITNNPLNIDLTNIRIGSPKQIVYVTPTLINENVLVFHNIPWDQFTSAPNRCTLDIYYAGLSFTLSEFMVTPANMNDGVFEPYCGDIIPITFPVLGKNKFDQTTLSNFSNYTSSPINSYRYTEPIYLNKNTTYTIWATDTTTLDTTNYYVIYINPSENDPDYLVITNAQVKYPVHKGKPTKITFTTGSTGTIRFGVITAEHLDIFMSINWQLELGSNMTTYEPYNPDNTVYGGYVDNVAGEVVATHKKQILNGTEGWWTYREQSDPGCHFVRGINDKKIGLNNTISDTFPNANNIYFWDRNNLPAQFGDHPNNYNLYFNAPYPMTNGVSEWKAWLAENPITIVYPLVTPIHYPLSKTELKTFLDQNNIWSNTNSNTEVSYAIHDTAPIRAAKRRIAAVEPHIITGGSTFTTDLRAPLKSVKIYFNPVQEGTGDPSPTNIRPITGWTGLSLYHSGDNLYVPNENNKGYINSTGVINVDNYSTYTDLISVTVGSTYSFKCTTESVNGNTHRRIHGYNSEGTWVQQLGGGLTEPNTVKDFVATVTIPSSISYIRVSFRKQDLNVRIAKEDVYEVDWENEVGTLYGGYVDLVRGKLCVNTYYTTLSDAKVYRDNDTYIIFMKTGLTKASNINGGTIARCNITNNFGNVSSTGREIKVQFPNNSSTTLFVSVPSSITPESIQVVYELATTLEYDIDPQTLKTLRGTNNIWSNANGNIETQYWTH